MTASVLTNAVIRAAREDGVFTRSLGKRTRPRRSGRAYALEKWRWFTANRSFDVVQPDPMYAGGIMRNLVIQKMSEEAGLGYGPHFPRNGADMAPLLHLCAVAPNTWGFQEYRSRPDRLDYAHAPAMAPRNGVMPLPAGPGWGVSFDPEIWTKAAFL